LGNLVLVLVFSFGFLFSCQKHKKPLPNIVMIGIDALRPDHLGIYGYPRPTSPNIDRLAEKGVVFENAYSTAPFTLPSVISVYTSLYPSAHGISFDYFPSWERVEYLKENNLFQFLAQAGYQEVIFSNGWANALKHMLFNLKTDLEFKGMSGDARQLSDLAINWLDKNRSRKPFFMFLYYLEPHTPYQPPERYLEIFSFKQKRKRANLSFCLRVNRNRDLLEEDTLQELVNLYDAEIRYADEEIGRVINKLEEERLLDNTVIVIWADHGEAFQEHGYVCHSVKLYREFIQIPLIIYLPDNPSPGRRIKEYVSHIDIMPTLLELAGVDLPEKIQGKSLLPLIQGRVKREFKARKVFAELSYDLVYFPYSAFKPGFQKKRKKTAGPECKYVQSIISPPWHYIWYKETGREELFNLETDPEERENLVEKYPELAGRLREILKEHHRQNAQLAGVDVFGPPNKEADKEILKNLDREVINQLKSLGYLR